MSQDRVRWANVSLYFEPEGALREIQVPGNTSDEWQCVYLAIRARYATTTIDGIPLPADVRELLEREDAPTLRIDPERMDLHCHFWFEEVIEFNLDPASVASQEDLDRVCDFMTLVGQTARKEVILTNELDPSVPILRYGVESGVVTLAL